ncbi:MAG: ATP-binding protein [Humibacillus sp.]|nr:ATP-binding protein [Humibacillus sp.]MDN5775955.1 ATP-binding protein [Humibacillus sp.]
MDVDDLRGLPVFEGLTTDQLTQLLTGSVEVAIEPGQVVFHEGDHADAWWVLVDGALGLERRIGREDVKVGRMDVPGWWAGGFRAWDEHGVYLATARGAQPGRLLCVPAALLREVANAWFPMAGHLIAGLYGTARSIESTARQRSALVTLGTLAAGLAHEINNPAAAAARSADELESVCNDLLRSLGWMARGEMSPQQFKALDLLRQHVVPPSTLQDPLVVSDREEALASWLARHGVERGWTLAADLAGAGVEAAWCDEVAMALPDDLLAPGLRWVASTVTAATLIGEVKDATRRVSELVVAIKSYSQLDRASMQTVDVSEGIENTLVILGPKLRPGVKVERHYAPSRPRVEAYPGELNQVWTNLIDNAVDAMGGVGTLRISLRPGDADRPESTETAQPDSGVIVEISDTGTGMPPEVIARAFEAFYTTKDVGRGTGLGLDIAQRIVVERHSGTISVASQPGATTFTVRLPARHQGSEADDSRAG